MPRPALPLAALGLVVLLSRGPSARADGDEPPAAKGAPMEVRIYDVGALTAGHADYFMDRGPFDNLDGDTVNDESRPLFGLEGQADLRSLGSVTDIVELLRSGAGAPGTWEQEGATISEWGASAIAVKHTAAVHERVAARLLALEREVLTIVTVDVVAVRGEPPEDATLAQAIASGAVRPVAAARASGFVYQAVGAIQGGERSFLVDHDVEVAKNAKTNDPIVGVQNEGIAIRFRATRATDEIRLALEAWIASVDAPNPRPVGDDHVEVPTVDGRLAHAELTLHPGTWTWASASGGVSFAVRATARPFEDPVAWPAGLGFDTGDAVGAAGPIHERRFPVLDLAAKAQHHRGVAMHLAPSNYTPPAPPELPEPAPAVPNDLLAATLKAIVDPPSWEREGVGIEIQNDTPLVRHDERHLEAIGRAIDGLRARWLKAVRARTRVVTAPASSLAAWWAGGTLEDAAALLALPGAKVVDRGSVRMLSGVRDAYVSGVSRHYVGDFDVSIAEGASTGYPKVFEVLEGLSLDVRPVRVLGGGAYACETLVDRSTWRGSRKVATSLGEIECPSIGLTRLRGSVVARTGETRIVCAGLDGDEATFVLLTLTED